MLDQNAKSVAECPLMLSIDLILKEIWRAVMPTTIEYMQMATNVYAANPRNQIDPQVAGAELTGNLIRGLASLLECLSGIRGEEMVIAYTGTNDAVADPLNWSAGFEVSPRRKYMTQWPTTMPSNRRFRPQTLHSRGIHWEEGLLR
jgi:hypothetical protein